jgi:hypothetical protein
MATVTVFWSNGDPGSTVFQIDGGEQKAGNARSGSVTFGDIGDGSHVASGTSGGLPTINSDFEVQDNQDTSVTFSF